MKVTSYKEVLKGLFYFNHDQDDYNAWLKRGEEFGDSGPILHSIDYVKNKHCYKSFGTIGNPNMDMFTLEVQHCTAMDVDILPHINEEGSKNYACSNELH